MTASGSEKTVKKHHAHVMEKMQVTALAELLRMADKVGLAPESHPL